jgi:[histone H3]-lysine79 N-trimethyltransferase
MPHFMSDIFKETSLNSRHNFVDLGSGIGNAVCQAALEIGCDSWGFEIRHDLSEMATSQRSYIISQCEFGKIPMGKICMENDSFTSSPRIKEVLRKADVVLVNNLKFLPDTNQKLSSMFIEELKSGCQVVSLERFPLPAAGGTRNAQRKPKGFKVRAVKYTENSTSWTSSGGVYYITTKT